jgi:hypothetical protein
LEEAPLTNPEECACFLNSLFATLVDTLKDHHLRALEDEYFRIAITRDERIAARLAPTSSSKAKPKAEAPAKKPQSPLRTCAGHFGKQLKATFPDGRPYKCSFGQACKNQDRENTCGDHPNSGAAPGTCQGGPYESSQLFEKGVTRRTG